MIEKSTLRPVPEAPYFGSKTPDKKRTTWPFNTVRAYNVRDKKQSYLMATLHLMGIFALLAPFSWNSSTIGDLPFIGVNDPNPAEAISATLLQYVSLIFVVWLLLTESLAARICEFKPLPDKDTRPGHFSAFERLLPRQSILRLLTGALVTVSFIAIHEIVVRGDGVAIPVFLLETLPLTLILILAIRGFRIGAAPLEAPIWASFFLLLLPLQLHWGWLMLPLLYGPIPALLVFMWYLMRAVMSKSDIGGRLILK